VVSFGEAVRRAKGEAASARVVVDTVSVVPTLNLKSAASQAWPLTGSSALAKRTA